jgi:hypothetical protein
MCDVKLISGVTFTAVQKDGKWMPAKADLGTGKTTMLLFGFEQRDDAISYAMDNFSKTT